MLYASPLITGYILCFTAALGLVMGSFLQCLAWRIVHGESVMRGRSHCDECGHALRAGDLVPVVSWIAHRGMCRYCKAKISVKHPIGETLRAIIYVSIVARYGLTLEALQMLVFASALFVISLTDLEDFLVPTGAIVVAALARVVFLIMAYALLCCGADVAFVFAEPTLHAGSPIDVLIALTRDSFIGAMGVGAGIIMLVLIMDRVLGRESMGGGDVMLFVIAGFYFGWQQCLFLIFVACVIGLFFALAGLAIQQREYQVDAKLAEKIKDGTGFDAALERTRAPVFPFGPSIALACWVTMLVGAQVVHWYAGLF